MNTNDKSLLRNIHSFSATPQDSQNQIMSRDSNILACWGNKESMNLNSLVLNNIMSSQYFKNALYEKKTYEEVVDEIYYRVNLLRFFNISFLFICFS
jgi:hypothetical protein